MQLVYSVTSAYRISSKSAQRQIPALLDWHIQLVNNQTQNSHTVRVEPMTKLFLAILFGMVLVACQPTGPKVTHIQTRVSPPTDPIDAGEYPLGLGGALLVNGKLNWRDGTLYVPKVSESASATTLPLLVWLHVRCLCRVVGVLGFGLSVFLHLWPVQFAEIGKLRPSCLQRLQHRIRFKGNCLP